MDRLMSWQDEFFGRGITDQVYLVSTIEGEQAAMGVTAADRDAEGINSYSTDAADSILSRSGSNILLKEDCVAVKERWSWIRW